MNAAIVTDLRGRLRLRLPTDIFGPAECERLSAALSQRPGLLSCSYNPLTRGLLILYENSPRLRLEILKWLRDFQPGQPEADLPCAAPGGFPEEKLPPNPVWSTLARRFFLPLPLRIVFNGLRAIPHLFSGLIALMRGRLNVEVLDAAALAVCFLRRDFRAAGTLLFFFALSHYLEMWTRSRSRAGLFRSLAVQVEKVWLREPDGSERLVPESELTEGSLVVVRAGSLIAIDGVVVEGEAMVNQASMTGEPLPVPRTVGGAVFAGTSVEEGEIVVRADKVGRKTRVQSIVTYIEQSEASKAGLQGRAERLADSIVPFSFLLSALVLLLTRDPIKAGNILLVDYSCAIRLSTPLAVLSAMREGSAQGVLIKGGRYLEEIAEADTIVFDKTGTLTEAKPRVAEVIACADFQRSEVLRLAACLEEHFPHPVGRAVVNQAMAEGLKHEEEHTGVDYVVAHGICSTWKGQKVLLGSRHFVVEDEGIAISAEEELVSRRQAALGRSLLYLAVGVRLAGLIAIEDKLRPGARQALADLRRAGFQRAIMLTGDIESTAAARAEEAGFSEYRSQLLPDQKAAFVEELGREGRRVMMVGDGLNDSAALSRASVGVAMSDSSALARDVANVILLEGHLEHLSLARNLARGAMDRIKSNYRLIVGLNTLFLGLGLFGLAGPGLTALLHNATTAAVAWRSTRPYFKPNEFEPEPAAVGSPRLEEK